VAAGEGQITLNEVNDMVFSAIAEKFVNRHTRAAIKGNKQLCDDSLKFINPVVTLPYNQNSPLNSRNGW
jgi:hypothetical protein